MWHCLTCDEPCLHGRPIARQAVVHKRTFLRTDVRDWSWIMKNSWMFIGTLGLLGMAMVLEWGWSQAPAPTPAKPAPQQYDANRFYYGTGAGFGYQTQGDGSQYTVYAAPGG